MRAGARRLRAGAGLAAIAFSLLLSAPVKAEDGSLAVPVARPQPAASSTSSSLRIAELDHATLAAAPGTTIPDDASNVSSAPADAPSLAALGPLANIANIRLGDRGLETRFVVEMSGPKPVDYQVFTLSDPFRVVIDLKNTGSTLPDVAGVKGQGLVGSYRYGTFQDNTFRVVIDTVGPVKITRKFALDPQSGFGYRIVLDMAATDLPTFMAALSVPSATQPAPQSTAPVPVPVVPVNPEVKQDRRRIVVIDPGHGGVDPGTHGKSGVLEKDVVLLFGKELAKRLRDTGRYEVYMTRDKDVFIPLRERVAISRRHKADLFISIHADSISKSDVSGMSVYTLSETASDKEAAALARKENLSDAIAGIDFRGESPEVAGILIDLAQRETKNYSSRFAKAVVDHAQGTTPVLERTHRFAGFVVLKAPDVPSVLIELGFLTNRADERNLTSSKWRTKVSSAFVQAVDRYFGDRRAEGPN